MAGAVPAGDYSLDYSNQQTDQAKSGDIKNGPIFNISGVGSIGTVKLLAMAGIGWLLYRIFSKK